MSIVLDKVLTDLEHEDAITKEVYDFFKTRPKQRIGFTALRDNLKVNHDKLSAAIKKLKNWRMIVQVGYDAGATYRMATEEEYRVHAVVTEIKATADAERVVAVLAGHEEWCRITSTHGDPKCTCKVVLAPTKEEKTLPTPLAIEPNKKTQQLPAVQVRMPKSDSTRVITEVDVLAILCDVERATSVEIAALLDVPTLAGRISAVLSSLFTRNMVGRSGHRDGGGGAFLYYLLPNATTEGTFTTDVLMKRADPQPTTLSINDPYKALFMRSIYERIIKGEELNGAEKEALAIALGVTNG